MSYTHLKNALRNVHYISSVTFTGGEPSLPSGIRVMQDFMEICRNWGVRVGSFYIATNGKRYRREFVDTVRALYFFCDDNEVSAVEFSDDPYHDPRSDRLYWELSELAEFELQGLHVGKKMHLEDGLIRQGRCNWGYRDMKPEKLVYRLEDPEADESDLYVQEPAVYLNCKGNIVLGCDWSYADQDRHVLCTADQFTPDLIIEKGEDEDAE